jgi:hypothetical protein
MARTFTPERLDDMTLTQDDINKFNYYCFAQWGITLDVANHLVTIGRNFQQRTRRLNQRRNAKKRALAAAAAVPASPSSSSTDSETKHRLIDTAKRIRKALTPPASPPKTPSPRFIYPPTPSPSMITE